jgi:mannose-6-phosphate isomerase
MISFTHMKPFTEKRPWGDFRQFTANEKATVKILTIRPGQAFSLQRHRKRSEFWRVLSGIPRITIGRKTQKAKEGDEFVVPRGEAHRIGAGRTTVRMLEISTGDFDERDVVRLEDRYGRVKT